MRPLAALAAAAWLAAAGAHAAQRPEPLRPCRADDLIGLWAVVRFGVPRGTPIDRSDPAFAPHQRYVFHRNATMLHATAAREFTGEDHRRLLREPATSVWAVDEASRLLVQRDGAPRLTVSACRVVTREVRDERSGAESSPGDVLLTEHDAAGRPVARRQLRRLMLPAE